MQLPLFRMVRIEKKIITESLSGSASRCRLPLTNPVSMSGSFSQMHYLRYPGRILLPLLFLLLSCHLQAQETHVRRRVEILHSDSMKYEQSDGRTRNRLSGNVSLKHNDLYMDCDSAWYYDDTNQVLAYSNIHIWQGDTIHIRGEYLSYNGNTRKAFLTDNVVLSDKEMQLFTDKIDYDVNTQVANYDTWGRILNGDNTLTSRVGIYYSDRKMLHFRDSVKIVNPDYVMTADTMRYDTSREIVWFTGPTEAIGDSIYLYCENGWSDTRNDVSQLMKNAVLDNREQRITGDTLWYDERSGIGEGFGRVTITDTTDNITGGGNYAWYVKRPEQFLLTGTPWFTLFSDDDTLTLRADTLRAIPVEETAGVSHRLLKAYHECRIFSHEMQGKCDSLSFSFQDSVIRLYDDPVVWSRAYQMTADSIALFTVNSKADRMEMYNSAFVVSEIDTARYDQISGKNLSGFFTDNKLTRINVTGNSEAIYYVIDGEELVGVNRARSSTIEILFEESRIVEIIQRQSPDGVLNPPLKVPDTEMRLDGFRWHPDLRPDRKGMGIDELFPPLPEDALEEVPEEVQEETLKKATEEVWELTGKDSSKETQKEAPETTPKEAQEETLKKALDEKKVLNKAEAPGTDVEMTVPGT